MELDQFKQKWRQANANNNPPERDLKSIFNRGRRGPVAALKRNFRRRIVVLVLVCVLFLHEFRDRDLFNNVFFLWFVVMAFCLAVLFYLNLRVVKDLEKTDEPVAAHIQSQVDLMEKRIGWYRMFTRVAFIVLIILLETLPYFSGERMLQKWHSVAPLIRVAAYAALLLFQYYAGRMLARKRYGQYLERLQNILHDAV